MHSPPILSIYLVCDTSAMVFAYVIWTLSVGSALLPWLVVFLSLLVCTLHCRHHLRKPGHLVLYLLMLLRHRLHLYLHHLRGCLVCLIYRVHLLMVGFLHILFQQFLKKKTCLVMRLLRVMCLLQMV